MLPSAFQVGPAAAAPFPLAGADLADLLHLPDVLNLLPIGLHIENERLESVFVNDSFVRLFGYRLEEIRLPELWWPLIYPDADYRAEVRSRWFAAVAEAQANGTEIAPQEYRVTCKGGGQKVVQFHCRRIGSHHVHAYLDVSARHRLEAELRLLADTDALTGLPNRRRFMAEAHASGDPLAVLLVDVDHFKAVNDRHGHAAGDALLTALAMRCTAALGGVGLFARLGGEEFAALLSAEAAMAAEAHGRHMLARVAAAPFALDGLDLAVTVSIGGARRQGPETLDALLARADRALYAAKRAGRNAFRFDGSGDGEEARHAVRPRPPQVAKG